MLTIQLYRAGGDGTGAVATFLQSIEFPCRMNKGDLIMLKSVHYLIIDCVFRPHEDGSITQIAHVKKA